MSLRNNDPTENFFSGILVGFLSVSFVACILGASVYSCGYKDTMIANNLAHYDEKTKKFTLDSLEFKNDTIIIRKKN